MKKILTICVFCLIASTTNASVQPTADNGCGASGYAPNTPDSGVPCQPERGLLWGSLCYKDAVCSTRCHMHVVSKSCTPSKQPFKRRATS